MDLKTEIQKLLGKSVILTKEQKIKILQLLDLLNNAQLEELLSILNIERIWINTLLEKKYVNDLDLSLFKGFKEFKDLTFNKFRIESESDIQKCDYIALNNMEEQLKQI